MTDNENGIMRDVYYFLRDHNDPPPLGTDACADFFAQTARDTGGLITKWRKHPLSEKLSMAIYEYLEIKCKAKAGESS